MELVSHVIAWRDGQPHYLLDSASGRTGQGQLRLAHSGRLHSFIVAEAPPNDGARWVSWADVIDGGVPESVAESVRFLPGLLDRSWICAITGCKVSSPRYTPEVHQAAFEAGKIAADLGFTVLTGGLSGVMSRAAEGARSVGGPTIGILPGLQHADANPHLQYVLPSGLGYARNFLMAAACDVMLSLPGGTGTLEELLFAIDLERDVIGWGGWAIDQIEPVPLANTTAMRHKLINVMKKRFAGRAARGV
jgi:uncharacterized protein (TIGR00725 family)